MAWTDRVVEFPSRVKLNAVSGQDNVYDLEAQEGQVYVEGTLLNAENFTSETNNLIEAAHSNHKWRYVGSATGINQNDVVLPNDDSWDEVYVKIIFGLNNGYSYAVSEPRLELSQSNGANLATGGYAGSSDYTSVVVRIQDYKVRLMRYNWSGQDANASFIRVYVR